MADLTLQQRDTFVRKARREEGKPYWAHRDCSGFTAWAAREAGFLLPEGSVAQFSQGRKLRKGEQPQAGDLHFWDTFGPAPGHVALDIGGGKIIHALNESAGIRVSDLDANMGGPYMGARRLFPDEGGNVPDTSGGEVTPQTPWRDLGNTDRESFEVALSRSIGNPSPMAREAGAIYDVLLDSGLTRLAAVMCWIERHNDTNPEDEQYYPHRWHNAWAVKKMDGSGFARYSSYTQAAAEWAELVTGPVFADQKTVDQFINRYAPDFENDTNRYIRQLVEGLNDLPRIGGSPVEPDPGPGPGPGPAWSPVIYDLANDTHAARFGLTPAQAGLIMGKRIENRGGASPQVIGLHVQWGNSVGSLEYWLGVSASSTIMVQADGSILRIIPPKHGPWTQGDVKSPDAQMRALLGRFGDDPNVYSLTIEAEDNRTTKINAEQKRTIVWQIRQWWKDYPQLAGSDWRERIVGHFQINAVDRSTCGLYTPDIEAALASSTPDPGPVMPVFKGLPAWLPSDFFTKAVFPLADPAGPVTQAVIRWITENGQVPRYIEKVDIGNGRNLWRFDRMAVLNDGKAVWLEGESPNG